MKSTSTIDNASSPRAEGYQLTSVTPHLVCKDALAAMDFYKNAFGAEEMMRLLTPDGQLMHGAMRIGNSAIMLVEEMPQMQCHSPVTLKGSPVTIHLQVPDADATFAQAVSAGAKSLMPVAEMFWGDRYGVLQDPFGHGWSVATHVRDVPPEKLQEAARSACCGEGMNA